MAHHHGIARRVYTFFYGTDNVCIKGVGYAAHHKTYGIGPDLHQIPGAVVGNVPCALQGGGGIERNGRIETGSENVRIYLLPQDFKITKHTHIIAVNGVKYNITEVADMGGRERYLRISAERISLND